MTTQKMFNEVTIMIMQFITEVEKSELNNQIYDIWTIKDILCHVTFWHLNYAANLEAEEKGRKPPLLKGKYTDINLEGAASLKDFSTRELIVKLLNANSRIGKVVSKGKIRKMTYKEGSRDYSIKEFLNVVKKHIHHHMEDIKHANKSTLIT